MKQATTKTELYRIETTDSFTTVFCDKTQKVFLGGSVVTRTLPTEDGTPEFVCLNINTQINILFPTTSIEDNLDLSRMETTVVEKLYHLLGDELQDRALSQKLDDQLQEQNL